MDPNFNSTPLGPAIPIKTFRINLKEAVLLLFSSKRVSYGYMQYCGSGSGIRCLFDPWIRDPGWVKKSGSGSGMNNLDHISESLEHFLGVKILKFFDADAGSGINILDPNTGHM
jgi:hypothetical protein